MRKKVIAAAASAAANQSQSAAVEDPEIVINASVLNRAGMWIMNASPPSGCSPAEAVQLVQALGSGRLLKAEGGQGGA